MFAISFHIRVLRSFPETNEACHVQLQGIVRSQFPTVAAPKLGNCEPTAPPIFQSPWPQDTALQISTPISYSCSKLRLLEAPKVYGHELLLLDAAAALSCDTSKLRLL